MIDKNYNKEKKGNLNEYGAYFHMFSIHQHPVTKTNNNIDTPSSNKDKKNVLLLRLSTKSFSEKTKWMETISDTRSKYNDFDDSLIPHLDNTLSKNQTILSSLK